jgi:hypothetical protein
MDTESNEAIEGVLEAWKECLRVLSTIDDPHAHAGNLNKMATTFVGLALRLRADSQGYEYAACDLLTDTFSEIVRLTEPLDPSDLDGEVAVHARSIVTPYGVRGCQSWLVRYEAKLEHDPRSHPS